jgi:TPP-dependent pyruvate/acetoin dehydrogenase alpha subunit
MNFTKVYDLPAIFVCENNFYGEFTPMVKVTAGADIAARARPYDIPARLVDGNDLWAVHEAAREAVDRARGGGGPTLLECQTYRHYGHSKSDPGAYRPKEEVERWMTRDPLQLTRERLLSLGVSEGDLSAAEESVREVLERAVQAGLNAPYPDPAENVATEFAP